MPKSRRHQSHGNPYSLTPVLLVSSNFWWTKYHWWKANWDVCHCKCQLSLLFVVGKISTMDDQMMNFEITGFCAVGTFTERQMIESTNIGQELICIIFEKVLWCYANGYPGRPTHHRLKENTASSPPRTCGSTVVTRAKQELALCPIMRWRTVWSILAAGMPDGNRPPLPHFDRTAHSHPSYATLDMPTKSSARHA